MIEDQDPSDNEGFWENVETDSMEHPPSQFCSNGFRKWKNMESFEEDCLRARILPLMLKTATTTTTFAHLSRIRFTLSAAEDRYDNLDPLVDSLVMNLHNAPCLENLDLERNRIDFNLLEKIHSKAPNLQKLKFGSVKFEGGRWPRRLLRPAKKIHSLIVQTDELDFDIDGDSINLWILDWVLYIGMKYLNLVHLKFDASYHDFTLDTISARFYHGFEGALMKTLKHLQKLKAYQVNFFPNTDQIVTTMTTNNIQLESLEINTKDYASPINPDVLLSTDYQLLLSSKSTQAVKSLSFL